MELHSHADIRNGVILWRGHWTDPWWNLLMAGGTTLGHFLIQYVMQLSVSLHLFISHLVIQMDRGLLQGLVLGRQKEMFCLTSVSEETKLSVHGGLGGHWGEKKSYFLAPAKLRYGLRKTRNLITLSRKRNQRHWMSKIWQWVLLTLWQNFVSHLGTWLE